MIRGKSDLIKCLLNYLGLCTELDQVGLCHEYSKRGMDKQRKLEWKCIIEEMFQCLVMRHAQFMWNTCFFQGVFGIYIKLKQKQVTNLASNPMANKEQDWTVTAFPYKGIICFLCPSPTQPFTVEVSFKALRNLVSL